MWQDPLMAGTKLDRDDITHLYEQLASLLEEQILSGEIPARHPIPSKRELTVRFAICGTTVDRATRILKDKGLIAERKGRGLFVVPPEER